MVPSAFMGIRQQFSKMVRNLGLLGNGGDNEALKGLKVLRGQPVALKDSCVALIGVWTVKHEFEHDRIEGVRNVSKKRRRRTLLGLGGGEVGAQHVIGKRLILGEQRNPSGPIYSFLEALSFLLTMDELLTDSWLFATRHLSPYYYHLVENYSKVILYLELEL